MAFKTKCKNRSFLWYSQLISFHNARIIHGAMPLYMVLCHYTWCYAIIHGAMPFFRGSEILKTKYQTAPSRNKAFRQSWEQVANSSVGTASDWKVRSNTDSGSSPRWCTGFVSQSAFNADSLTVFAQPPCDLSPSHLSMQTLLRYSHSPRVQSHASTSVSTLKNPSTGSHIAVFGHHNTAHTDSHIAVFGHHNTAHTDSHIAVFGHHNTAHTDSHIAVFGHHNTAHTDSNG